MIKRSFDLGVAITLVILTLPVAIAAAIAVRLSSPGPIIFRQQRVGRFGAPFWILKFRTMRPSAQPGMQITAVHDSRITPVGALLRKWKIDELPQMFNVLRGEMSIVGPRPDVPSYVALYPADLARVVLSVRPGITDRASIKYRNESELLATHGDPERYYRDVILLDKLAISAAYASRPTIAEDMRIIMATIRSIIADR